MLRMVLFETMAVAYGAGAGYAAKCPRGVIPQGFRYWNEPEDGPIPSALVARANALADDLSIPLGATESYPLSGVAALLVVEPHTWTRDRQGNLIEGCFHACGAYVPTGEKPAPPVVAPMTGLSKTAAILTIASLSVGLAITGWELAQR